MSQRTVESLIGRLITDDQFRADFLDAPERTLVAMRDLGFDLTAVEIMALVNTNRSVWTRVAEEVDSRLRKASLVSPPTAPVSDGSG